MNLPVWVILFQRKQQRKLCQDIEKFRKKAGMSEHSVKKEQLINWKILKQSEGQLLATNAYALLTSDYFSFSKTQCAVFKGTDRAVFLDKREFTGPIYTQIEEAVDFVLRNIRLGATIDGLVRREKYELPPEAIREMIINAHCHRNLLDESCIQVAVYDDRLEVTSPGGLYNGLTYEEVMNGHSKIRNKGIANIFSQMGLVEAWGSGIKRILNAAEEYGLPSEGNVQSMIEDNSGNIWLIRESSVDKYNPKTKKLTVFGPNDFDLNMTFSEARPIHDPVTDNITVGTATGSLTFNPARLKQTDYQPRIIFTELHYNGSNEYIPILHQKKIVIPANKRNLSISFAALDYTRKYQQFYKYRIDGNTPEGVWIDLRGQNRIGFNRISHGNYVLKVIATNTHGKWSKYVASLELDVQPTFWESIWGKLLIILIIAGVTALCFITYNKQQKERINHEMNEMKNRFFSKASHKLRTPLTLIGGPIDEVLEKEDNLSTESRSLLQMVQRNAKEMLYMLNKMLKFDNGSDFYLDEGSDQAFVSSENNGSISDETAKGYLKEVEETEEDDKTEQAEKDITILVVEDNPDLRQFLFTILKTDYNVLLAENGKEGLVMARNKMPDFILTDVTMPVMDGFTMVHYIKQDTNTAHIPIIVLSAKASVEDHLRGFEEGVDGYLTKPFSATYLKGRIEAVINQRHALQQDMLKQIQRAEGAEFHITHEYPQTASGQGDNRSPATNKRMTEEDALTEKIVQFINENMSNPDLKIDDIAVAMGMSRSVLYGKIKNAVGMKPIDFVRHIRIMRATELLCNTDETLSSIAYSLGFSDPKYFSKVFKKEMGIIPSEYRENSK